MTAGAVARHHFDAAIAEAKAAGIDPDVLCRSLLGMVIAKYLETRQPADVRSELHFVAENCDPDTDLIFIRP